MCVCVIISSVIVSRSGLPACVKEGRYANSLLLFITIIKRDMNYAMNSNQKAAVGGGGRVWWERGQGEVGRTTG